MAGRIGMDVGVVRECSVQLGNHASALDSLVGRVDGIVSSLAGQWHGSDAQQLHDLWTSRHRHELAALAGSLHTFSNQAKQNAAAQELTSSGTVSGGAGVSGAGSAGLGMWGLAGMVGTASGLISAIIGSKEIPSGLVSMLEHSGVETWEKLGASLGKSGAGVLTGAGNKIEDIFKAYGASDGDLARLGEEAGKLGKGIGIVGVVAGGISTASSFAQYEHALGQGNTSGAVTAGLDTVASALKSDPDWLSPMHLTGQAIAVWTDVAEQASKTEWDLKWTSAIHWDNWESIVLGGAADGLKQGVANVWKDLT